MPAGPVLKGLAKRWSTLKEQWGRADFRLWSYDAIERWYTLVYLVLAFLTWRAAPLSAAQMDSVLEVSGIPDSMRARVLRRLRSK